MPLNPLGDASALLALYQAAEKLIKDKVALNQALKSIEASAYEIFPNDIEFILRLLTQSKPITFELTSKKLDKREHLKKLFEDAYDEAPGLAWSSHHENLVEQFATKVSEILLGYGVNEAQSATDYLDSRAQERHEEAQRSAYSSASDTNEILRSTQLSVEQLTSKLGRDQQSRQEVDVTSGSLKVRRLPASTSSFTGRTEVLAELSKRLQGSTQVIHGLGGIGKTQLAVRYALTYQDNYDVMWRVRSESSTSIAADFGELAVALRLAVGEDETDKKLSRLKGWLAANSSWLLIFDDLQELDELNKVLILESAFQGKVLITSRNSNWGNFAESIPLDVWVEEEAIQFLKTRLKAGKYSDEEELRELGRLLGNLPLALEQAAAYINATPSSVQAYSDLFAERRKELWHDKRHETHPDDYPYTVATTWAISIEKMQEDSPGALSLLHICSFFAPDDIPLPLLVWGKEVLPEPLTTVLGDPLILNQALGALSDYSLLSWQDDFLGVHQLVQAVVRDSIAEPIPLLEAILRLQIAGFPFDVSNPQTWAISDLLTRHLPTSSSLALENGADKMLATIAMHKTARLLNFKGQRYEVEAAYSDAEALLSKVLTIRKQHFGDRHGSVAVTLGALADSRKDYLRKQLRERLPSFEQIKVNSVEILTALVKTVDDADVALEETLKLYEEAREIDSEVYGNDHHQYALRISRIGAAYVDMAASSGKEGLLEKAESLELEALKIVECAVERQELPEYALIFYLHSLSRTLLASGKAGEAKKYLERCLKIAEEYLASPSPHLATIFEYLGYALIYDEIGKWATAKYFRKAREIAEILGMREIFMINTFNLATSLAIRGRELEAENYMSQIVRHVSQEQLTDYRERFANLTKGLPPSDLKRGIREIMNEILEMRKRDG